MQSHPLSSFPHLSSDILSHVPKSEICTSALALAHKALAPAVFHHSLRVFLLAKWLAQREGSDWARDEQLPFLFIACICHDLGTSDLYNGRQRFEIEGADAACEHMHAHGISSEQSHPVWVAIALHTSAGIAERIDPFTRLVRLGVKMDFSAAIREMYGSQVYATEIELELPRLEIEKVLGDAVVKQAVKIPDQIDRKTWPDSDKHPKASWPGILLRAHLENPDHDGVNLAF